MPTLTARRFLFAPSNDYSTRVTPSARERPPEPLPRNQGLRPLEGVRRARPPTGAERGISMRRPTRPGPRCVDAPARPAGVTTLRPGRADGTSLVDLARRMSIPEEDVIRQVVDRAVGLTPAPRPRRS